MTVGRDEYLGTAKEVVAWMAKAKGAPQGGVRAYMRGIRARLAERGSEAEVNPSSPTAFLESLAKAGLVRVEEKTEASPERWDPREILDEGPVALGEGVETEDLESDVFGPLHDAEKGEEKRDGKRNGRRG